MGGTMPAESQGGAHTAGGHFCSNRTLRSFFERSGMCLACLDTGMRLAEVNADFARQFGRSHTALVGRRFCDLLHNDVKDQVRLQLTWLLADQLPRFTEPKITFHRGDADDFSGELTAIGVNGDGGGIDSLVVLVRPDKGTEKARLPAERKLLLTEMDATILEGVAAGVPTVQIASMLYLSRGGIEYHVNVLMRRLRVKNRPALVSKAYSIGMLRQGWPPRVHPDHLKRKP